ncbi:hypothetical protein A2U01_0083234, partial [Trifolium medium]|nr:hypothetical protein [Trifolium medium]
MGELVIVSTRREWVAKALAERELQLEPKRLEVEEAEE